MMKKQALLLAMALFSITLRGQTIVEVTQTTTPPSIDGMVDVVWVDVDTFGIHNIFGANTPTVISTWRALWDEEALYLLVDVEDEIVLPFSSHSAEDAKEFKYDKIEVYFDINDTLLDARGPNSLPADERSEHSNGHFQSAPSTDEALFGQENTWAASDLRFIETVYSYQLSDRGYVFEAKLPWDNFLFPDGSSLDATMAMDHEIGFDIVVVDRDELDGTRQRVAWQFSGTGDEPMKDMDQSGIIVCRQDHTGIAGNKPMTFSIYPNPAAQYFTVENAENAELTISNICGKIVMQRSKISRSEMIRVSGLAAGIYFVSVNGSIQKLMIQ